MIKRDLTTEENRAYWAFVDKIAAEAEKEDFQRGAVTRLKEEE